MWKFINLSYFYLFVIVFNLYSYSVNAQPKKVYTNTDTLLHQRDVIDYLKPLFKKDSLEFKKRDTGISNKRFYFSLLPTTASVPGGGAAFVTSTNVFFYMGDRKLTKMSELSFTPYTNFNGHYVFPLRSLIWLNKNSYKLIGDLRFMIYPQNSWGLGGNTPDEQATQINYNYFRFYETALKRFGKYFSAGMGINVDHHSSISTLGNKGFYESLQPFYDSLETFTYASGYNVTVQYESSNYTNNPSAGMFLSASFRNNPSFLNSTGSWNQWYFDARKYISFSKSTHNVLAFWAYYWLVNGEYIPFLDLPSSGWDSYERSARGIKQSRYRSDKHWYFESEYRRNITRNGLLGFVVFASVSTFSEFKTTKFDYWHPAGGFGLRIKLNKFSRSNITLDYAFSKEYNNVYLNISEVF